MKRNDPAVFIPLGDVPKHVPGNPHIVTVRRWIAHKAHPLETWKVGGRVYTTPTAIRRFILRRGAPRRA